MSREANEAKHDYLKANELSCVLTSPVKIVVRRSAVDYKQANKEREAKSLLPCAHHRRATDGPCGVGGGGGGGGSDLRVNTIDPTDCPV
jgi:hypothetical protein